MQLDINEIREIIPHRYPFLLIDRVTELTPGVSATAEKCVSGNEPFFQGHFPDYPVMPGVLIIEALAQTGAVSMLSLEENRGKLALFAGLNNVKFKRQVVPGDVLELCCKIVKNYGKMGVGEAVAKVDGEIAAKALLTFAIVENNRGEV